MSKAIIGRKLGMTQVFDEKGIMIPVTVVLAGPMTVVQMKTAEKEGYVAVQMAFEDAKRVSKPIEGHFKAAGVTPKRILRELKIEGVELAVGKVLTCGDLFKAGDIVDVSGRTKGKGFSGVIKRWNQARLKMTHGSGPTHRSPGSIGANSDPSKVIKGLHMPGHLGNERVTIQNLHIVKVDNARNILLISGAIPGPKGSLVTVKTAFRA